MSNYEQLDEALLKRIRDFPGLTFLGLDQLDVRAESRKLCAGDPRADVGRIIDKRLQNLRRRKLIEYRTKTPSAPQGWYARTATA